MWAEEPVPVAYCSMFLYFNVDKIPLETWNVYSLHLLLHGFHWHSDSILKLGLILQLHL